MEMENVVEIEVEAEQMGPQGLSAYEIYLNNGGTLSETEWLESLEGPVGPIGPAGSVKFVVVTELPTDNIDESAIYMKPAKDPKEQNTYEEYIYTNGNWESLGTASVEVDLTDYPTKDEVNNITGNLENLSTEDKSNIVNAINEVFTSGGGGITELTEDTNMLNMPSGIYFTKKESITLTVASLGSNRTMTPYTNLLYFWNNGKESNNASLGGVLFTFWIFGSYTRLVVYSTEASGAGRAVININLADILTPNSNPMIFGEFNFRKLPITGLTPTSESHLVNKKYVDDAIASLKAELSGGV